MNHDNLDLVPEIRRRVCNGAPRHPAGDYVLYWMIAHRRLSWNFSLQRAVELAVELQKPLLIFEPLRIGYRWACDRFHRFIIDGMTENSETLTRQKRRGVQYYPYVEPEAGAGKSLLLALAKHACCVVTDDFPSFFLPQMVAAAAARLPVQLEAVDSNGLLPMRATERVFTTAFSFRAYLQKSLTPYLATVPHSDPLARVELPPFSADLSAILQRWPAASPQLLNGEADELSRMAIDHSVSVVAERGGTTAARARLTRFLDGPLVNYAAGANDLDVDTRSGLSPYLHFGHISAHELFSELATREEWAIEHLGEKTGGKREGWWGMSPGAEAWLDELITWREISYNFSSHRDDYDQYEALPDWAQATLARHESDRRAHIYSLDEFANAATHDALWNAAQTQLVEEGRIHNYLRMLWGKKILEWSTTARDALAVMIELNNRYALDGRNPNSYSGIFWVLGRYDRPWGPERPIFGTVRYMSSDNTARKLKVKGYLERFAPRSSRSRSASKHRE